MKKIAGAIGLVLAVFSLFFFSDTVIADKADYGFSIPCQYCFSFTSMDGAGSVRIEVKPISGSTYETINGLDDITSPGNYHRTTQEMYNQFGCCPGEYVARVNDNGQFNHFSKDIQFTMSFK
ncbi:MAG: hypothetical protein L0Y79_01215 [Chlorobi bacterium]|nr:hypothetical protein [Chlorobiota bacterium]MCI0715883.1 hypothetical protein [Chlorobiota bacterium]